MDGDGHAEVGDGGCAGSEGGLEMYADMMDGESDVRRVCVCACCECSAGALVQVWW